MTESDEDRGGADPELAAALASGEPATIARALTGARLLVGVVALPGDEHASEGEMALAMLQAASGARALPAFTSLSALAAWRPDARPVPRPAAELAAHVLQEELSALVIDVAGPVPWALHGDELATLAEGYAPANERLAVRRAEPELREPSWEPSPELTAACAGLEVYAVDVELKTPRGPVRGPALALVPPDDVPPAPLAERLLAAAGQPLDLMLLDEGRRGAAAAVGRPLG